jgi:hypothetical protein
VYGESVKKIVSVKMLLYFLILMILFAAVGYYIITGTFKGTSNITTSVNGTVANFAQADLTGTWHVSSLDGGSRAGFVRSVITVVSNGTVIFNSYDDGSNGKPAAVCLTIDHTTGAVTDRNHPDNHLTMAANKKFIAGTLHSSGTSHPGIIIFQKEVPGTSYANSDLQGKGFVYHELKVSSANSDDNAWEYGGGRIDSSSKVTRTTKIKPSGAYLLIEDLGSISVDSKGIVSLSNDTAFEGFLSVDKKTIVGTTTKSSSGLDIMIIIQITDNQSSSTSGVAGTWHNHMLTVGSFNLWAHQTINITDAGIMTFSDWASSNASLAGPTGSETITVASSGTATLSGSDTAGMTFNGQVSYDGTFMIATQTLYSGEYSLMVFTKKP